MPSLGLPVASVAIASGGGLRRVSVVVLKLDDVEVMLDVEVLRL